MRIAQGPDGAGFKVGHRASASFYAPSSSSSVILEGNEATSGDAAVAPSSSSSTTLEGKAAKCVDVKDDTTLEGKAAKSDDVKDDVKGAAKMEATVAQGEEEEEDKKASAVDHAVEEVAVEGDGQ